MVPWSAAVAAVITASAVASVGAVDQDARRMTERLGVAAGVAEQTGQVGAQHEVRLVAGDSGLDSGDDVVCFV